MIAPALASLPIVVSDLRRRRVALVALLSVFVVSAAAASVCLSPAQMLANTLSNCAIVLLLLLALASYLRLRYRGRLALGRCFGAGDACYMASLSPLLPAAGFLRLMIASALLALVWQWAWNRGRRSTVPFAAMIGIALAGEALIRLAKVWLR